MSHTQRGSRVAYRASQRAFLIMASYFVTVEESEYFHLLFFVEAKFRMLSTVIFKQ